MPGFDNTDTQKNTNATGNLKDTHQTSKSDIVKYIDNQSLRTNPFEQSLTAEQIYKRAERIAAALFLVTSHVPDLERLRTSVREGALRLIELALAVRISLRSEESHEGEVLVAAIRRLISEVRLLGVAGYVSLPNTTLLVTALDEMGHLLSSAQRSSLSEFHVLAYDDLVPTMQSTQRQRKSPQRSIKDRPAPKGQTEVTESRGDRIVGLLRTSDLLGIKDIAVNMPEYSEKMIQRELADLVAEGRVNKVGAKRWSRYGFIR